MVDDDTLYEEEGGFWQRIKESPRTVSALIVILIVAAAIYAFSGDQAVEPPEDAGEVIASDETMTDDDDDDEGTVAGTDTAEAVMDDGEPLPEARQTSDGYVEVAQPGEGYTHLARRATSNWLNLNQAEYEVTDEHRIYIEDYIQNQLGTRGLSLGEEQAISFTLIEEAVAAAGNLSEGQLKNLSQYTSALK